MPRPRLVEDPPRSSTTTGIAVAAAALLALTACGDGADADENPEADSTEAEENEETFPVTIDTEFGEVTVEEQPERVVALGWGDAEMALQLGVEPVGAADWIGFGEDVDGIGPWAQNPYSGSPEILGTLELSYEAVAELEPDLILDVNSSGEEERYERLSSIATTVGVGPDGVNYMTDRDEQLQMIGAALGEAEQAEQIAQELDDAFAEVASEHPEWADLTVTVATRTSEGWGAYTQDGRLEFMEGLGFTLNPTIAELSEEGEWSVTLSDEQIDAFDADLIVAFPIWIETEEITEDDGWNNIPAVEDGRAIVMDTGDLSQAFSLGTPEAKQYALEELVPMIEEVLEGYAEQP